MQVNKNKRVLAISAMIFTATMWGISYLSTKVLLREMGPMLIAFSRFAVASVILGIIMARIEPKTRLLKGDLALSALAGFFGTTLYFIFENTGLKFTTASNAVLIISTIPVISMLVEMTIHKRHVMRLTKFGILTSILGVITIIGPDSLDAAGSKTLGNLLILGSAFAWVGFRMWS